MKVYNQDKTQILEEYDLTQGKLVNDILVIHHSKVEPVKEVSHYETLVEYPNGGKEVKKVIDTPAVKGHEAYDENEEILVYVPYTQEELTKIRNNQRIEYIKERLLALSEDFIQAQLGAQFDDYDERKAEFISLHNELRQLLGKEPRIYE